jgi:hypothetical protein
VDKIAPQHARKKLHGAKSRMPRIRGDAVLRQHRRPCLIVAYQMIGYLARVLTLACDGPCRRGGVLAWAAANPVIKFPKERLGAMKCVVISLASQCGR